MADKITASIAGEPSPNRHLPPGDALLRSLGQFAGANHHHGVQ